MNTGMGVADNKEVVLAMLRAVADADYRDLTRYLHDDVEFYVIGSTPYSGLVHGREALIEQVLEPLAAQRDASGYSEDIVNVIGEGDFVVTESQGRKKTKAGQRYDNEYLFIFEFREGRIARWRCYLDTQLLADTHPRS